MRNHFNKVVPARVGRSVFDLSYEKKFTGDMGFCYPSMCDEVVPGDFFKVGVDVVVRFLPLVAPVLHEINCYIHYFFVPYRLLWDDWEDFITGGIDGNNESVLPRWNPGSTSEGSLWDYFGFPVNVTPTGALPLAFPQRAYWMIYNEYYRDENVDAELDITVDRTFLFRRRWEKDYFTSALPWQQRGTAPALPISGTTSAVYPAGIAVNGAGSITQLGGLNTTIAGDATGLVGNGSGDINLHVAMAALNNNVVDLESASTFDIADLRLAIQIQRWMERNARCGARYTEFLRAHFGVAPTDERLDRPEYIGGTKLPVIVSEVRQTSATGATPQANLAGTAMAAASEYVAKYHVQEYGLIMGILSVVPRSLYQQGIDRQWLRRSRYDFYHPEFANLSEQAIERAEIYANGVEADNRAIFGYAGRYDELRTKRSMVCGALRSTLDYWHISRQFSAAPELNSVFVECNPRKDFLAAPYEPTMVISVGNRIIASRPLPAVANPGYMDH